MAKKSNNIHRLLHRRSEAARGARVEDAPEVRYKDLHTTCAGLAPPRAAVMLSETTEGLRRERCSAAPAEEGAACWLGGMGCTRG